MTVLEISTVRTPLIAEMEAAGRSALSEPDPMRRAWQTGMFLGYGVAFGLIPRKVLDDARREPWAWPVPFVEWRPRFDATEATAKAVGIRYGYKLGNSERHDIRSCELCSECLVDDIDYADTCEHGTFCEDGCKQDWHNGEPSVMHCISPDWDDDYLDMSGPSRHAGEER